jgi:tetratricopeptide (TPR) repeat protein
VPTAAAVAAALVAVGLVAWNSTRPELPPAQVLQWYEDAQQALAEGASVRALNAVNRAIELAPWFAPSHALLAEVQLELDMPGRAQESMLKASEQIRRDGGLPDVYTSHIAGMQALLLRRCDDAIRAFRTIAGIDDPSRSYRMVRAARVMERCDRPDQALALMKEGAALDPRNAAVPLRQAFLFARQREWEAASAALAQAESLFRDRNNVEGTGRVLLLRGSFFVDRDLLDEGEAVLANAAAVARSLQDIRQQVGVLIELAVAARKRGRLDDADRAIERALELGREANLETLVLEGLFASGNARLVRSELDQAQTLFERALSIAETHRHEEYRARAWLSLASLFIRRMEPDRAERAIQSARPYYQSTNQARNLAIADNLRGQVLVARAEFSSAIALYRTALAAAIRSGDEEQIVLARLNLAGALVGAAEFAEALEHYHAAASAYNARRPRNLLFTTINIADTLSRMGLFADAQAAFTRVERSRPIDADVDSAFHASLAAHELRKGRPSAADREVTAVLRLGDLSRRRTIEANAVRCVAQTKLGSQPKKLCADTLNAARSGGHVAVRLETTLTVAEAMFAARDSAGALGLLRELEPLASSLTSSELHWRLWALLAAAADSREEAKAHRVQLTRELSVLRLKWKEPMVYEAWAARSDVAALLADAMNEI